MIYEHGELEVSWVAFCETKIFFIFEQNWVFYYLSDVFIIFMNKLGVFLHLFEGFMNINYEDHVTNEELRK